MSYYYHYYYYMLSFTLRKCTKEADFEVTFMRRAITSISQQPQPVSLKYWRKLSQKSAIDDVELEDLFLYDTNVFGFERHALLPKWLRSSCVTNM